MTTMTDPVLDLAEDTPPVLWVRGRDGKEHVYQTLDDLGLNARNELDRAWRRVNELRERESLSKAEEKEYLDRYGRMVRLMLPTLPSAEVKALSIETKESIVQGFFSHRTVFKLAARLTDLMTQQSDSPSGTGSRSSPNSSGTTEPPLSEAETGATSP